MNQRVLDISAYQGEVDFQRVKRDGIWGVMLKATEGERYLSPAFEKNYQQAKQAELEVGAYHYLRASTVPEAVAEANFFLSKVKEKQLTLPLAVDIEAPEQRQIEDLAPIAAAFCDTLDKAGYYATIYSTVDWFKTKLSAKQLDRFDRWIAEEGVSKPNFEKPYGMWQFTWNAQVDGINGRADESVSYRDYPNLIRQAGLNHLTPELPARAVSVEELRSMGYQAVKLSAGLAIFFGMSYTGREKARRGLNETQKSKDEIKKRRKMDERLYPSHQFAGHFAGGKAAAQRDFRCKPLPGLPL